MNLRSKKELVAKMLKIGKDRVWFDEDRAEDIKAAITRDDLRNLIREGGIRIRAKHGASRVRAREKLVQKRKGRRKGIGSRKGKHTARLSRKTAWVIKIKSLRNFFTSLRDEGVINQDSYRILRKKAKGGIFRSKRHAKLFLEDSNLFIKKEERVKGKTRERGLRNE